MIAKKRNVKHFLANCKKTCRQELSNVVSREIENMTMKQSAQTKLVNKVERVVLLKNIEVANKRVNGTLATVVHILGNCIFIKKAPFCLCLICVRIWLTGLEVDQLYLEGIHKTVNLCIWVSSNGNYKEKMLLFVC